ncbi:hypothetical protein JCM10213_009157 [Rhodosporidiobolus nylandii]
MAQDGHGKAETGMFGLTPEQEKKALVVVMSAVGTALLLSGRTGSMALKRAKASEGSAAAAAAAPPPPPPAKTRPTPPPPTAPKQVLHSPTTAELPRAPSPSFLNPNALTPPKPRRLLPSFVNLDTPSQLAKPPSSAYFLPNPTLLSQSTAFASQLDKLDKLHEEGSAEAPPVIEDGFNPAIYAAKALGIATAITFSAFGLGIFGLMQYLGVDDLEGLALALSHHVSPVLDANRPSLPAWALPSSGDSPSDVVASPQIPADEEEELSYWASIKQELDKEAEERKKERAGAWERMKRRAEELKGTAGKGQAA